MLKIYLTSVFIYMIMIYAIAYLGQYKIKENGWLDDSKKKGNPWVALFCLSAVPVFRLVVIIALFIMIGMTKEDFDKLVNETE